MFFNAEFPFEAVRIIAANVKDGDYTSPETIDAACHAAGCLNAMRGPAPLGADEATATAIEHDTDEEKAERLLSFVNDETSLKTTAEAAPLDGIPPWVIPIALDIISRILQRWVK